MMQRLIVGSVFGALAVEGIRKPTRRGSKEPSPSEVLDTLTQRYGSDPFKLLPLENAGIQAAMKGKAVATLDMEATNDTVAMKTRVAVTETDYCAPPTGGVCLENGRADSDCCARPGDGGCAEGYIYTEGGDCGWSGAKATCCIEIEQPQCKLSESSCSLSSMREPTLVYPDTADAKCWSGESYAFLVHPGRTDKVLFNFPGGGICFDYGLVAVELCFTNFLIALYASGNGVGPLDRENADNVLKDYTWISPLYCGGGAHVANTTAYNFFTPKYQHDYVNVEHALNWALRNTAGTLNNLVVTGTSAGSLGITGWADRLLSSFSYRKASVLLDSYFGVFPENTLGYVLGSLKACDIPALRNVKMCQGQGIVDQTEYLIAKYPNVAFGTLGSKRDEVQAAFYSALGLVYLTGDTEITPEDFYEQINDFMYRYNQYPNYVTYIVDSAHHTFTSYPLWYTTTVVGEDTDRTDGKPKLHEWFAQLVNHEKAGSQCYGPLRTNGQASTSYCDKRLYPKTLSM